MKASSFRKLKAALLCSLVVAFGYTVSVAESAQPAAKSAAPAKKEAPAKIDPNDPSSLIYLDTAGKPAGVGGNAAAPASQAFKVGMGWHPQALAGTGLPKDKYGLVDWAKLVRENIIKPKASLDPEEEEMPPLKMDILIPAKGSNDMTMVGIVQGQWCGRCHNKIAFPLTDCNRCHSSPKKAAAK